MLELALFVAFIIFLFYVGHINNGADWGNAATNILDGWLRLYCKKYHRQGNFRINIPDNRKLILVSNHLSAIDPFLLIAAVDRPVRFMIAKEEYDNPFLNWMFRAAGCIPVDRSGRVEGAFRSALRAIEAGELVAIFPQGGIHSSETPRKIIKPGIVKLSQLSNCSILPVRVNGIVAPGTMLASVIRRSNISFDVSPIVEPEKVVTKAFREQISQWFIHEKNEINL